jgi:hypothetical protein
MYNTNLHDGYLAEVDVDANDRVKSRHGILTGTLLLTFGCCASAIAASSSPDCEKSARGLQSLMVSVGALAAQPADEVGGAKAEKSLLPDRPAEIVNKAVAPLLQLTPHIAAKLNSVFDSAEPTSVATQENPATEAGPKDARSPASAADGDADESTLDVIYRGDDIARFQHQMYRKDI